MAQRTFGNVTEWVVAIMAAAVASCAPPPGKPDYRAAYPIEVESRTFTAAVRMTQNGDLWRIQEPDRLDVFVRDYMSRARTPLVVSTPPVEGEATDTRMRTLLVHLVQWGVNPDNIEVQTGTSTAADRGFVLSFRGYEAKVLECGDWSGETGFNPTNLPGTNFGCAYQRNIGLMLADPGDLVQPRALGARDAQRVDTIMRNYRQGKIIEAEAPEAVRGTITGATPR